MSRAKSGLSRVSRNSFENTARWWLFSNKSPTTTKKSNSSTKDFLYTQNVNFTLMFAGKVTAGWNQARKIFKLSSTSFFWAIWRKKKKEMMSQLFWAEHRDMAAVLASDRDERCPPPYFGHQVEKNTITDILQPLSTPVRVTQPERVFVFD